MILELYILLNNNKIIFFIVKPSNISNKKGFYLIFSMYFPYISKFFQKKWFYLHIEKFYIKTKLLVEIRQEFYNRFTYWFVSFSFFSFIFSACRFSNLSLNDSLLGFVPAISTLGFGVISNTSFRLLNKYKIMDITNINQPGKPRLNLTNKLIIKNITPIIPINLNIRRILNFIIM